MARQFLLPPNARALIQAENHLKTLSIPCKVMPVLRALSSECGMCLEVISVVTNHQLAAVKELSSVTRVTLS